MMSVLFSKAKIGSLDLANRLIRTAYGPFQLGKLPRNGIKDVPQKVMQEQFSKEILTEGTW